MGQTGGTSAISGGLPKIPQWGWYKRRLPFVTPLPLPGSPGVAATMPLPALLVREGNDAERRRRRAIVQLSRAPMSGSNPPRPFWPWVVRQDYEQAGRIVFETPRLKTPPLPVAGGVLAPWVVRRDYQRGALVYRMLPFLKAPPPPVPGGVPPLVVRRWDFERAAQVYAERFLYRVLPALAPPPVLVGPDIWHAEGRGNEWDSDRRTLVWSAEVAEILTKRSGETRLYTMDFSALPELQSAALSTVSSITASAITVGAGNVTLTNPALGSDGKSATVWIAGGAPGASYKIAFTVTIAGGTVLEDFGYLLVEDE